jgi:hypothetical protein
VSDGLRHIHNFRVAHHEVFVTFTEAIAALPGVLSADVRISDNYPGKC